MFKTRRTKIVSAPVGEILEVDVPEPEQEPEPQQQTVYNIEQLSIIDQDDQTAGGILTDGDGKEYEYVWNKKLKRIDSLSGERIDRLTWELCNAVLIKYWVRAEPKIEETPIELKIVEALKVALAPVVGSIKSLESQINNKPAQVAQQPMARPQTVQPAPAIDIPAISVADSDISANAMKFLQQSSTPDLGIDYMSL